MPPRRQKERRPSSRPRSREEENAWRADRRRRAATEPLDLRPRGGAPYPVIEVRNPLRETRYLVLLPAYPDLEPALCNCTDFARRGLGTCKHIESVREALPGLLEGRPTGRTERSPISLERLWEEIERPLEPSGGASGARALRARGEALLRGERRAPPGRPGDR